MIFDDLFQNVPDFGALGIHKFLRSLKRVNHAFFFKTLN
jgi:hypothetical protein